jgi:dolichol-phosphate mannosyltransferase
MSARRWWRVALLGARFAAALVAITRLARAIRVQPPVRSGQIDDDVSISVVVPARDEADRIGPLLRTVVGAPGVQEVIVVDDQSTDATAEHAARLGARIVTGAPLPVGWAGKAWALQQGFVAATTDWVVALDADTRPDPLLPTALVQRARADGLDLLTVAGRFECPTAPSRWLHAAMLTTLVYRFGPPGSLVGRPARVMANGQCMAIPRQAFLERGAMAVVAGAVVEDLALARAMSVTGAHVAFLDASELLTVRMFESFVDTWHGWGRSLALPGVDPLSRQLGGLAVVVLAQALPLPRLVARRGDLLDVVLTLARIGTLVGTRRAYDRVDTAYWASPLADAVAAVALARGVLGRRAHTWRGRRYGRPTSMTTDRLAVASPAVSA